MHRRSLIAAGLAAVASPALAQNQDPNQSQDQYQPGDGPQGDRRDDDGYRRDYGPSEHRAEPYTRDEIYHNVSDFFGVTAENTGALIEKLFHENGSPTAYIAGTEGSGALVVGARYGTHLFPETWIIDKRGVIRARFDGAREWTNPLVINFVDSLRAGDYCPVRIDGKTLAGKAGRICDEMTGASES